jgi:glycosyltransferase involved in cell wall biosynthesis
LASADERPLVSIVLPTFNGERHLRESLDSCLEQTHAPLEVVVVDDCSTDSTPRIVEVAAARDPRVRAFRHATNRRLPAALNTGFREARGRYLTWTSDDNRYEPTAIATMVAFLEMHPDVGMVCCDMRLVGESGEEQRLFEARPDLLDTQNRVGACFLYRREVAAAVGEYRTRFALVEDYDYWLRVAKRFRIAPLSEPLYRYRLHPESLTSRRGARVKEQTALLLLAHEGRRSEGRKAAADLFYDAYWRRRAMDDRRGAATAAWRALRLAPLRRAAWKAVLRASWMMATPRSASAPRESGPSK